MYDIITSTEIEGSAAQVWRTLTDFPSYPSWNPVIRSIEGRVAKDQVLKLHFQPEGSIGLKIRVTVVAVAAEREFRWIGSLLFPRLFCGDHYFLIETIAPNRVKLLHGERFSGVLAPIVFQVMQNYNRAGFVEMNRALKARVENLSTRGAAHRR